jgi:TIR domain/Sel1 repeat
MEHDVFISHSSQDKPVADAVCAALENTAIRCWIAPRDVQLGLSYPGQITRAIKSGKVIVLIFSAHTNASDDVLREVQLAASSHLHIVQFRIEDVVPNDDLLYYLSAPQRLDALTPPLESNVQRLGASVKALLEMDSGKVVALYQKADDQGSAYAQYMLGWLYANGQGVQKELAKAAELYQKAADQGFAPAQYNLGVLYANGQGMQKDLRKAAELYQKAADQGDADAQNNLGRLYEDGQGVPKDPGKAAELFQKAADQGLANAQYNLGVAYENGQGVPKNLAKAAELFQKAADQGSADAQNNLGVAYENGQGVPKDLGKAAELYQKAADQGEHAAIANLKRLSRRRK